MSFLKIVEQLGKANEAANSKNQSNFDELVANYGQNMPIDVEIAKYQLEKDGKTITVLMNPPSYAENEITRTMHLQVSTVHNPTRSRLFDFVDLAALNNYDVLVFRGEVIDR